MTLRLLTLLLVLAAATGAVRAADEQTNRARLVLVEGGSYVGEILSLDRSKARLLTDEGKTIEIPRDEVAFINFHPDWIGIKAYGVANQTYYDFNVGFAVPLPAEGWVPAFDSEGHLFLSTSGGTVVMGFYAYLTKYASLDSFLTVHADWRRAAEMPESSYTGGADSTIGDHPARAFIYDTELQGSPARAMDVKTVSPEGYGLVVTLMCSSTSQGEFETAKDEAKKVLGRVRFLRQK